MYNEFFYFHLIFFGGLIGSTVFVELTRQCLENRFGNTQLTENLKTTYDGLCKITGYACTPYYALFWKLPIYLITNFPRFVLKIQKIIYDCLTWLYDHTVKLVLDLLDWCYRQVLSCLSWIRDNILLPILTKIQTFFNGCYEIVVYYMQLLLTKVEVFLTWCLNTLIYWVKLLFKRFLDWMQWIWTDILIKTFSNIWYYMRLGWTIFKDFVYVHVWKPLNNAWITIRDTCYAVYLSASQIVSNIYETMTGILINIGLILNHILKTTYETMSNIIATTYKTMTATYSHNKHQ